MFHYGTPGDVPVTGDWNGDGIRQIGVFRDGQWNLDLDGDGRFTEVDATVDVRPGGRHAGRRRLQRRRHRRDRRLPRRHSGSSTSNGNRELDAQDKVFELGGAGDKPVVGDWNDDGTDDPGVYQPGSSREDTTPCGMSEKPVRS